MRLPLTKLGPKSLIVYNVNQQCKKKKYCKRTKLLRSELQNIL